MRTAKEVFDKMLEENEECTSTEMMIEFARMHLESFVEEMDAYDIFRYEGLIEKSINKIK